MISKFIAPLYFIVIFIASWAIIHSQTLKKEEIESLNKVSLKVLSVATESIMNTFSVVAKTHKAKLMENEKLFNLLLKFKYEKVEKNRALIRGEIYRLLHKEYDELKGFGVRHFHFHDHEGVSLLRFHSPSKNGDPLANLRESVRIANSELREVTGYEGGRVYPGFRYVFPILKGGEHLGSIEFSIPLEAIEIELQKVLPSLAYGLHNKKELSIDIVFENFKEQFYPSPLFDNHYVENSTISKVEEKVEKNRTVRRLHTLVHASTLFHDKQKEQKDFSISFVDGERGYSLLCLSIKDTQGKHGAYLVAYNQFDGIVNIEKRFETWRYMLYGGTLIILILMFIIQKQFSIEKKQKETLQNLIDLQENIIILSDGKQMGYANQKLFDFFGFKNLKEFLQHHTCICETFVNNDNYFHLGKVKKNEEWIDALTRLPESKRVVAIKDRESQTHIFSVALNHYEDQGTIINFIDITATSKQLDQLYNKAMHDKLTNAYSREYFDENYQELIGWSMSDDHKLAIAMVDIDHFKRVNDTYGHDVGDIVLKEFVARINQYSRHDDILIRWGGEEFILLVKVDSKQGFQRIIDNLLHDISSKDFERAGHLTCSIGGTIYCEGELIEESIKRADEALYWAKQNGRNQSKII